MAVRPALGCGVLFLVLIAQSSVADEVPAEIIAINGRDLPQLLGVGVSEVTASAVRAGAPTAVHLQIDQRTRGSDGSWQYTFESGAEPRTAVPPVLGNDDLILLAVDEGGDRVAPPLAHATEIEAVGADGTSRWFYVSRGKPRALAPRVSYDDGADRVSGEDYTLGFSHNGTPVIDTLLLGDPREAVNLLDRSKARLDVDLALGIGTIARTEEDVRVRTTGLHVGPLRIIRECEVRGRMLLGLYSPPVRDNFIFYAHGFVLPTTIRMTPTARMLTRVVTLRISMDLVDASGTLSFASAPELPSPVLIDGHGGTHGGQQPIEWYMLRGHDIGLLGWLDAPADIAADVTLYYRDDRTAADPPERIAGEIGDHGFLYRHHGALPAGDVHLSSHAWVLHGPQLERPAAELRTLDRRLTVRIH